MSLLPYFYDEGPFAFYRPRRLLDQHFGLTLTPEDLLTAVASPLLSNEYYRNWRNLATQDLGSNIQTDADKIQINLDVQQFNPEEISVKTADGYVIIEGKHEEKKDKHGLISRHFVRKYQLPEGTARESVESKLSSDGVLTITAPRKIPDAIKGERKVPITHTGPVRKEIKNDSENKEDENNKE